VRAALLSIVSLGHTYTSGSGNEVTETQRRALIHWAAIWAKDQKWESVRSYLLWFRRDEHQQLRISLRVELFGQVGGTDLAKLSQNKFTRLAEVYGIAAGGTKVRGGAQRATELNPKFVAELLSGPEPQEDAKDGRTGLAGARTREENNVKTSVGGQEA
jgi:hypothetical protein